MIPKPASPFLSFEQMALHYRKSCLFMGHFAQRGLSPLTELRLLCSQKCEFVRAEGKGPCRGLDQ